MLISMFERAVGRRTALQDPWHRMACTVPLGAYGKGARRGFRWYFRGTSRVPVESVDGVIEWLMACTYVRDEQLFFEADYWQHPCTFEQLRKGDCEDFSLWAWRKLAELGESVEFVAGRCRRAVPPNDGHTWVHLRRDATIFVLDPTMPTTEAMLRPLEAVREDYLPEVSVEASFTRFAYAGYLMRGEGNRTGAAKAIQPVQEIVQQDRRHGDSVRRQDSKASHQSTSPASSSFSSR